jgi:hypothetical protein
MALQELLQFNRIAVACQLIEVRPGQTEDGGHISFTTLSRRLDRHGGNDESQGVREVLGKIPAAAFSDHGDLVVT